MGYSFIKKSRNAENGIMKLIKKDYIKYLLILPLLLTLVISTKTLDRQLTVRYVIFALVLFSVSLVLLSRRKKISIHVTKQVRFFFIILSLFILVGGISLSYTNNFSDGLFALTKFLLAGIYIFYLLIVFEDPGTLIKYFTRTTVIVSLVITSIGLYQIFLYFSNGIANSSLYNITVTFGNKNIFVQYAFFILPFNIFVALTDKKYWNIAAVFVSAIIVVFITLLMTRSVWVAFILSAVSTLGAGLLFKILKLTNYKRILISFALLLSVIAGIVSLYSRYDESEAFSKQITGYGTEKGRLILWQNSLEIYNENPIVGKGLGSWKIEILKHADHEVLSEDNLVFYQRPHNDFIWVLCELGIIGAFAYIAIFIYVFYLCIKLLRSDINPRIKYFTLALIFFLAGFLVVSFFSFPLDRMEHIILLAFVLASVLLLSNYHYKPKSKKHWVVPKIILIIFSAITLFAIYLGGKRYHSEAHLKKALHYKSLKNWRLVASEVEKANSVFYRIDMFSTPVSWYKGLAYFNLKKYEEAYSCFKSAYSINPYHIYVLNDLASCSSILGKNGKSLELYKKVLRMVPDFEDALYNISTIYYQEQKMDSAYAYFSKIEETNTKKYDKYMRAIAYPKIRKLMKSGLKPKMRNELQAYIKTPEKLKKSIQKAREKNSTLEKQLLMDLKSYIEEKGNHANLDK